MTKTEVLALLKANTNERGLENWKKLGADTGGLKSFGLGLTQLRKLAKKIGKDHKLALQLWRTKNHDAKIIGLLIDEPKQITREQAESQVEEVDAGMLAHVFSSCDATLPKTAFAFDLAAEWIVSKDEKRRRCGYGLIYELSKKPNHKGMTDGFCLERIADIDRLVSQEESGVKLSMGAALMGLGKRNKKLNRAAVKVAKRIGPIDYNSDDSNCEPFDVLKHLTSDYLKEKLGL